MLVRDGFQVLPIVKEVWRPLAGLFMLDVLVTIGYVGFGWTWITPTSLPLPLLGTGLAVFLGLRNNTAYARWWEARTLWGSVVNNSRSFARGVALLMPASESDATRRALIAAQIAWANALRSSLRRDELLPEIVPYLSAEMVSRVSQCANAPFAIQREMAHLIATETRRGRLDTVGAEGLNKTLSALCDAQGGLERIRNTPMPQQYASFSRLFVAAYCFLLPFGIVPDLNVLTPLGSAVIAFVFLALDVSGRHLEDPFARSVHDVPMSAITRTIEIDLKQALGQEDGPIPIRAVLGVLR